MIKPDGLWNFFKSGPDLETIGRVCMALAGRESEIGEPLNKYELGYMREIINSDEWHEDASQRISDRKRRDYLQKKEKLSDSETGELKILTSRLSIKPSLAKKAKMAKTENVENADIRMYPSIHPSVRPSIRPSKKNLDIISSSSPLPPVDDEEEEGIRSKGSDEFKHVSRDDIKIYFARMRQNGGKNLTDDIEDEFWQYLVMADFKKGDGYPITKANVHSTFNVWMSTRRKAENEIREKKETEAKKAAEVESEAERKRKRAELLRANTLKYEIDE